MKESERSMRFVTARLVLSPITMEFADDVFREFTPEITRYMWPTPPEKREDSEEFIRTTMQKTQEGEEIVFAILHGETKEFLGCAGLHKMQSPHPEFGIWLKKSAHGNGYGREAITAIKQWCDAHLSYEYILYPVDRDNISSRKIPESLGGVVHGNYQKKTPSGKILQTVEYRIFPPTKNDH